MTTQGVQGGIFQMLSHGWISGALFLCVGVIYDRMQTREIAAYGGLVNRMPIYAALFLLFTMANVGLPGTSGFVGEFLTIIGTFQISTWTAFVAASGVILSAVYALSLYRRVTLGKIEHEGLETIADMDRREILIIAPLAVATILFGIWPMPILDLTASSVDALVSGYQEALAAHHSSGH
jgi:NADH-quinone oxidoreductase subunit M